MKKNIFNTITLISCILVFSCAGKTRPFSDETNLKEADKERLSTYEEEQEDEKLEVYEYYANANDVISLKQTQKYAKIRKNLEYLIATLDPEKVLYSLADIYELLGVLNIREHRYKDAIKSFADALEKESKRIKSILGTGVAYFSLKQYDKSAEHFNKVLELEKDNFEALLNLGVIAHEKVDDESAGEYFQKAIMRNPRDYRPYFNIAEIYCTEGNLVKAELYYRKALSENKSAIKVRNNLAFVLLKKRQYKKASELLDTHGTLPPTYANFFINLAVTQRSLGRLEDAEKNYLKALDLNPKSTVALRDIGILYDVYLGKRNRAVTYYEKYLELGGKDKKNVAKWVKVIKGSGAKRER